MTPPPSSSTEATDIDGSSNPQTLTITDDTPAYVVDINTPDVSLTTGDKDTLTFLNGEPELQISVLPREGWMNFAQGTPKVVTVTAISTVLLLPNVKRQYASFTNNSSQLIYIEWGAGPAVYGRGYPIPPNGTFEITKETYFLGQVQGIASAGFVNIDVKEGVK
jgi:hypothetical protein